MPKRQAKEIIDEEDNSSSQYDDSDDDDDDDSRSNHDQSNQSKKKVQKTKSTKNNALSSAPLELAPTEVESHGLPPPSLSSNNANKNQQPIIVLLDQANVETVKNKRGVYELLNCDDHRELCKRKFKRDPNTLRPDILHQELLALLDSPLNKCGLLKVYVQTLKNVLIEIHPSCRIPRTYKRFAGLMVQLLHKMKIKASDSSTVLLRVIKNPFSQYLPAGTRCLGMSSQGTLYSPIALAQTFTPNVPTKLSGGGGNNNNNGKVQPPICYIVGAMASGHITLEDHPYIEKMISVSQYPLSGAGALSRIVTGIEHVWGIN